MVNLLQIGIILIVLGFVFVLISALSAEKSSVRGGVVGFIGPIPFGFASDKKIFYVLFAIAVILVLLMIFRRFLL